MFYLLPWVFFLGSESRSLQMFCSSSEKRRPQHLDSSFMPSGMCYTNQRVRQKCKSNRNKTSKKVFVDEINKDNLNTDFSKFIIDSPEESSSSNASPNVSCIQKKNSDKPICNGKSAISDDTDSKTRKRDSAQKTNPNYDQTPPQLQLKPHCSCPQCVHWTDSTNWVKSPEYSEKPTKKLLEIYEISFFRRTQDREVYTIMSVDYNSTTKLAKLWKPKVLFHG